MKNYRLNPAAKSIDAKFEIDIEKLESMGWDFDNYHQNTAEAMQISFEEAKKYNYENYQTRIHCFSNGLNIGTLYQWFNLNTNESTEWEDTGDDKLTIDNIATAISSGVFGENDVWDDSMDDENNFVPTFVEA